MQLWVPRVWVPCRRCRQLLLHGCLLRRLLPLVQVCKQRLAFGSEVRHSAAAACWLQVISQLLQGWRRVGVSLYPAQ